MHLNLFLFLTFYVYYVLICLYFLFPHPLFLPLHILSLLYLAFQNINTSHHNNNNNNNTHHYKNGTIFFSFFFFFFLLSLSSSSFTFISVYLTRTHTHTLSLSLINLKFLIFNLFLINPFTTSLFKPTHGKTSINGGPTPWQQC